MPGKPTSYQELIQEDCGFDYDQTEWENVRDTACLDFL